MDSVNRVFDDYFDCSKGGRTDSMLTFLRPVKTDPSHVNVKII